jgi:hypothetical protein
MARVNAPASALHKAIAAIAEYLEDEFSPELFSFVDGGETLDICSEALSQCKLDPHWQALAQTYEAKGGSIYCAEDNSKEVA